MTFDWAAAAANQPSPSLRGGASGFFSTPRHVLDPALFQGRTLRPGVAETVLAPLSGYLSRGLRLKALPTWLRAWLAGSGVSYQWSGDRGGNGDLDVLLGIDRVKFDPANPEFTGFGEDDLAGWLNQHLKQELWPHTADTVINGKTFEVTYFLNTLNIGQDIEAIHPYAAYSLDQDRFTVDPPELPADPRALYPKEWFSRADYDRQQTEGFVDRYQAAHRDLTGSAPGSPGYHNADARLKLVSAQAQALLSDIHTGRQAAFQGGGNGYGDWANFRWQQGKASGTVKALSEITGIRNRAIEDNDTRLYGGPVAGADELVRRAMLQYRDVR